MLLRELFVLLGLEVDEASFARGQLAAALVEKGLEKLVDIAKETVTEFINMVQETAHAGAEIEELSKITGVGVESLQNLMTAAEFSNVATGELSIGISSLARNMFAVKSGSQEAAKAFSKLGVKVKDEHGKLRGADDVLLDIADKFKSMPDGAEKTAQAMQLFGRAGRSMIPLLDEGREGIAELAEKTPNLTEEQIAASKDLIKTQRELGLVTKNLWQRAIGPLLPAIDKLLHRYLEWKKANGEIFRQKIEKYIGLVIKALDLLGDTITFVVKNIAFFEVALAMLIGWYYKAIAAAVLAKIEMAAAWVAATGPLLILIAAFTALLALFDDLRVFVSGGDSVLGQFQKQLQQWMQPQEGDSWFVTALKDFISLINDAIDKAAELSDWLGISDKKTRQFNQARLKDQEARMQETTVNGRKVTLRRGNRTMMDRGQVDHVVGAGGSVYYGDEARKQTSKDAREMDQKVRYSSGEGYGHAKDPIMYNPTTANMLAKSARASINNNIVIHANGMTAEQAKPMIKRAIQEAQDTQHEETAASFPDTP